MSKVFKLLTPVIGGSACNARCRFCVAGMTPANGVTTKATPPNIEALTRTCKYVRDRGCDSLLLTSKGEPTLWPDHVTAVLKAAQPFDFKFTDLQTNGIPIADGKPVTTKHLEDWKKYGLDLVAISVVHYDPAPNHETYIPYRDSYIDLPALIGKLHVSGFKVRLATVMLDGKIDSPVSLSRMIEFASENGVEQLTIRPVNKPEHSLDDEISQYVSEHGLSALQKETLKAYLDAVGEVVERLPWGGVVYNVHGQNVCLTNSLTKDDPNLVVGRQLIWFPDGSVSNDWQATAVSLGKFDPESGAPESEPATGELVQLGVTKKTD